MEASTERGGARLVWALGSVGSIALSVWCLVRAYWARTAEVSLFVRLPPLAFWVPALIIGVGAAAAGWVALRGGRHPGLPRIPAMIFVLLAFAQIFVLPDEQPMGGALGQLLIADALAAKITERSPPGSVLVDGEQIQGLVKDLPPPPLLVRGHELPAWHLAIYGDCAGPLTRLDAPAGTLVYCIAPDKQKAWVQVMGRSSSSHGSAELIAEGGVPFARQVHPGKSAPASPE